MITITRKNGNILFVNDRMCSRCSYNRNEGVFTAFQKEQIIEVDDVLSVTFNNDAYPTNLVFKADEKVEEKREYVNDAIELVYKEIDRIDEQEKQGRKERFPDSDWRHIQKSGYGRRFLHVCWANNIESVWKLLEIGRSDFERLPNMGRTCAFKVSVALKNLYGIDKW